MVGGMHRSGTSWLARALSLCGLDLGERASWTAPDNEKGFWEDRHFVELNEFFLSAQNGAWDNPTDCDFKAAGILPVYEALVSDKTHPMGFKDPRVSLLFGLWQGVFPDAVLVAPVRNPMEVALSLQARNGFDIEKGLGLWEHYNRSLIRYGCRFVEFPTQVGLERLVDDLGLVWNPSVTEWMDTDAIHHTCSKAPGRYAELHRQIVESIEV